MSKLFDVASKLATKLAQEITQQLVKQHLDKTTLKSRMEQIAANGNFNIAPSGHALIVIQKMFNGMPISTEEKQAALGDIYNYGQKNISIGFHDNDLNDAIKIINNIETVATTRISNLSKVASKIEVKNKKSIKTVAAKLAAKFKKLGKDLPPPAVITDKIIKATSATFFNAGGGGFKSIVAKPEINSDGTHTYAVYMTLIDHDNAMSKIGEELNRQILDKLESEFPTVSFKLIFLDK